MRNGSLRVVTSVHAETVHPETESAGHPAFLLTVADDDGAFDIISSRWVRERWAGAAPVEPSSSGHFDSIERMMLHEADRRRHDGTFDPAHPMTLDE